MTVHSPHFGGSSYTDEQWMGCDGCEWEAKFPWTPNDAFSQFAVHLQETFHPVSPILKKGKS